MSAPGIPTDSELAQRMKNDAFAVGYLKAQLRGLARTLRGTTRAMQGEQFDIVRPILVREIEDAEHTLRLMETGQ